MPPRTGGLLGSTLVVLSALAIGCGAPGPTTSEDEDAVARITVATASAARPAFEELGDVFTAETGIEVRFSFGSSGNLRSQILNGAPFDLFVSADVESVDAIVEAGHGNPETVAHYADGRLALAAPSGSAPPATPGDLRDPAYRRIAIANPEHAPYGRAARQVLERSGVAEDVTGRLIYGQSVADAFRITLAGNADAGVVALSLVLADYEQDPGEHPVAVVPADLHDPLPQTLVVTGTGSSGQAATRFGELVTEATGQEILARYGFDPPGRQDPT